MDTAKTKTESEKMRSSATVIDGWKLTATETKRVHDALGDRGLVLCDEDDEDAINQPITIVDDDGYPIDLLVPARAVRS